MSWQTKTLEEFTSFSRQGTAKHPMNLQACKTNEWSNDPTIPSPRNKVTAVIATLGDIPMAFC